MLGPLWLGPVWPPLWRKLKLISATVTCHTGWRIDLIATVYWHSIRIRIRTEPKQKNYYRHRPETINIYSQIHKIWSGWSIPNCEIINIREDHWTYRNIYSPKKRIIIVFMRSRWMIRWATMPKRKITYIREIFSNMYSPCMCRTRSTTPASGDR